MPATAANSAPPATGSAQQTDHDRGDQKHAGHGDQDHERAQHQQENERRDEREREHQHGKTEGAQPCDIDTLGVAAAEGRLRPAPARTGVGIAGRDDLRFDTGLVGSWYRSLIHDRLAVVPFAVLCRDGGRQLQRESSTSFAHMTDGL